MAFPKQAFRLKKSWRVLIAHETLDVIDDVGMRWFCALFQMRMCLNKTQTEPHTCGARWIEIAGQWEGNKHA